MFMLENHLSTDQNRVIAELQAAASVANFSLFLAGGAMRDMLGGFQIRDLDFVVEGNAPKLAKTLTGKPGARVVSVDERRHTMELVFPGGVTAEIGMITPPIGLNCFVVARYSGRPVGEVFHGTWPHFVAHIFVIGLFLAFPQLILWLPMHMTPG